MKTSPVSLPLLSRERGLPPPQRTEVRFHDGGRVFTLGRADPAITRSRKYRYNLREKVPIYPPTLLNHPRVHPFLEGDASWSATACTGRVDPPFEIGTVPLSSIPQGGV